MGSGQCVGDTHPSMSRADRDELLDKGRHFVTHRPNAWEWGRGAVGGSYLGTGGGGRAGPWEGGGLGILDCLVMCQGLKQVGSQWRPLSAGRRPSDCALGLAGTHARHSSASTYSQ